MPEMFIDLRDLRKALGEVGYVNAVWAMRVKESPPVREAHTRGWRWNRAKVIPFKKIARTK